MVDGRIIAGAMEGDSEDPIIIRRCIAHGFDLLNRP